MIAPWMAYCTSIAALCALGALSIEFVFRARRIPARRLWAFALLLSLFVPAVAALLPRAPAPSSHLIHHQAGAETGTPPPPARAIERIVRDPPPSPLAETLRLDTSVSVETLLAWVWLGSTLVVLCGATVGYLLLRRRSRRWQTVLVDGVPVLISDGVGPAVLGFLQPRIVLPEWALHADARRRRLILEHEREHIQAGDPILLMLGLIAIVAAPWNVAIWWQLRRLRLAIEIDCDARVLAKHPGRAHAYGSLLLEMGRSASAGPLPIAAFSEPASSLEKRIRAMTEPTKGGCRHLVPAFAIATLVLTSAAALPLPPPPLLEKGASRSRPHLVNPADLLVPVREAMAEATAVPGDLDAVQAPSGDTLPARFRSAQLRELMDREYPPALREEGIEGYATVRFTVGPDGQAREIEPVIADRPAFGEAAERMVSQLEFTPAVVGGEPVPERVEQFRVHFSLRPDSPRPDYAGIDRVLRSALEDHYPELLDGEPARLPYVFLVVDTLGQRVLSALDWVPPTIAHEPEAIRQRFPQLRDREFGPYGRRSVRLEPNRRPVEVFFAELDPPTDEMNTERRGPYPLGALVREHTVPDRVMLSAVERRHPEVHEQGIPADQTVWVVGTRTGEIRASGIAPKKGVHQEMERHFASGEAKGGVIGFQEARNGTRYEVRWTLID